MQVLRSVGLDPNDRSTDLSTPVGIGNFAGARVVSHRSRDGINQLGDEGNPALTPGPHRVRQRTRTPRSQRTTLGFTHAKQ